MTFKTEKIEEIASEIYSGVAIGVARDVKPLLDEKMDKIFPCQRLNTAYWGLVNTTCGRSGLLTRTFAWGIIVWITMAIMTFLGLCLYGVAWVDAILVT